MRLASPTYGRRFQPAAEPSVQSLRALRLAEALDGDLKAVQAIFRSVWVDGDLPDNDEGWAGIQASAGVIDGDALVNDPEIKARLKTNGDKAIAAAGDLRHRRRGVLG